MKRRTLREDGLSIPLLVSWQGNWKSEWKPEFWLSNSKSEFILTFPFKVRIYSDFHKSESQIKIRRIRVGRKRAKRRGRSCVCNALAVRRRSDQNHLLGFVAMESQYEQGAKGKNYSDLKFIPRAGCEASSESQNIFWLWKSEIILALKVRIYSDFESQNFESQNLEIESQNTFRGNLYLWAFWRFEGNLIARLLSQSLEFKLSPCSCNFAVGWFGRLLLTKKYLHLPLELYLE